MERLLLVIIAFLVVYVIGWIGYKLDTLAVKKRNNEVDNQRKIASDTTANESDNQTNNEASIFAYFVPYLFGVIVFLFINIQFKIQ